VFQLLLSKIKYPFAGPRGSRRMEKKKIKDGKHRIYTHLLLLTALSRATMPVPSGAQYVLSVTGRRYGAM
jgi:hypothetical protein